MIAVSGLAAGAIAATAITLDRDTAPTPLPASPSAAAPDRDAPVEARVAALEAALSSERQARQLLEDELFALTERLDGLDDDARASMSATGTAEPVTDPPTRERRSARRGSRDPEARRARLIDAGFSPAEAGDILRREAEIRMQLIEARYAAERTGERMEVQSLSNTLRSELGDDRYAAYLDATGRPTSVTISTVYDSSPALAAGLQPGDQVMRYDGQRVFSMNEIADLTLTGTQGEPITMDILRNGVPMQLSIPRGPLGVVAGRRFRR